MNPRESGSHAASARLWLKWSSIITCAAAAVLSISLNWLAAGSNRRIDVTSDGRHSLSEATRQALARLKDSVSIYVLVSHSDPLAPVVESTVDNYASSSTQIKIRWVDPDRNPGRFMALQSELGIVSGASKDGKSLSDAIAVLEQGNTRSYVTIDDVVQADPASDEADPRVEQALTRALRRLLDKSRPAVCFTQGHDERALDDVSPEGLSEVKSKLLNDSIDVRQLAIEDSHESLASCSLVVVAEPELPFSGWANERISDYVRHLGSLWVMSGTVPDAAGNAKSTGLQTLLPNLGVLLGSNVVIDNDTSRRLPDGFGESFFAQPADHAITRALGAGNPNKLLRVLVSLAPTIELAPGAAVEVLLTSSKQAVAIRDVGSYLKSASGSPSRNQATHELVLAVAAELGESPNHAKRRVVISPASIAINRALRSPGLVGNRAFVDGALSWLLARPPDVEIAAPHNVTFSLELSDSDLRRIDRFVLLIMPGAAILLSLAIIVAGRRRAGIQQ